MSYGVFDALGECYAVRCDVVAATAAKLQAAGMLDEAARCGHPAAPGWVGKRWPLRINELTDEQAAAIVEDGVPVLDREP